MTGSVFKPLRDDLRALVDINLHEVPFTGIDELVR